jgi:hypothetical protein
VHVRHVGVNSLGRDFVSLKGVFECSFRSSRKL